MAKKTAVVDIKLTGKQSLQELERELENVNEQISRFKEGEGGFDMWTQRAEELKAEIANVNAELANTGGGDVTAKVEKTGEAMVDAFKDGSDAVNDFADEGIASMGEVVDESENIRNAIDLISKVGKTFTTGMGGDLKGLSKGFTVMGQSAKVAGASIKASLAAAGIGLFLIVLQALIQNWDKLSKAIKTTRREKELFEEQKGLQQEADYVSKMTAEYEKQYDAQKKINESQGNKDANTELDYQLAVKKTEELNKQNQLLMNQAELADIQAQKDKKRLDGYSAGWGTRVPKIIQKHIDKLKEASDNSQRQADLLHEQIQTNTVLLGLYTEQNRLQQVTADKKKTLDELDAQIAALENTNLLLEAETLRSDDIYKNNQKILALKKERLGIETQIKGSVEAEDKIALSRLNAEREANKIANERRNNELKLEYQRNALELQYRDILTKNNNEINNAKTSVEESIKANDEKLEKIYQEIDATQRLVDLNDYRTEAEIKAFPFDKKGLEILKETLGLRSDDIKLLEEFQGIQLDVSRLSQSIKLEYYNRVKAMNVMHDAQLKILQTEKDTNDATLEKLDTQKTAASNAIVSIRGLADDTKNEIEDLNKQLEEAFAVPDAEKNWEKIAEIQKDIARNSNDLSKYEADIAGYNNEIYAAQQQINALNLSNLQIEGEITAENENYLNQQAQITYELENQLRLHSLLQNFLEDYAEEIAATLQLINQTFEFVSSLYDRQADNATSKMKDLEKELKKLEKREENIKELKEELKDADGERYNELLALIAQEEEAELNKNKSIQEQKDAINAQIAEQENKKMEAEYQAAKWRKMQGIVDATINGAIAFIKSMPNVLLMALTAAATAVSIGTIAAQKLPERPPKQALGGYQEGNSHALGGKIVEVEGGEYIINKKSTAQYLPLLEAINNAGIRKFAEGGTTAPVDVSMSPQLFDYDKLADAILGGIQPTVSVVEINRMQQKVRVLQNNARIKK